MASCRVAGEEVHEKTEERKEADHNEVNFSPVRIVDGFIRFLHSAILTVSEYSIAIDTLLKHLQEVL